MTPRRAITPPDCRAAVRAVQPFASLARRSLRRHVIFRPNLTKGDGF